jgi:hypothetical protein
MNELARYTQIALGVQPRRSRPLVPSRSLISVPGRARTPAGPLPLQTRDERDWTPRRPPKPRLRSTGPQATTAA